MTAPGWSKLQFHWTGRKASRPWTPPLPPSIRAISAKSPSALRETAASESTTPAIGGRGA